MNSLEFFCHTKDLNCLKSENISQYYNYVVSVSKVQAVIYMTRSVNDSENENVVSKAVEQTNTVQQRRFPWRVVPPVLPFSGMDIEKSIGIVGKFIKFQPSERNSGCFVAVITREVSGSYSIYT